MVAHDFISGRVVRAWRDELRALPESPFPIGSKALLVAFYASKDIGCFLDLGWPLPANVLDLYAEFRCLSSGGSKSSGNGLLGALTYYGLAHIQPMAREEAWASIHSQGPWDAANRQAILDDCDNNVQALLALLRIMAPRIDWPRALLRGRYVRAAAKIERDGIPLDIDTLARLRQRWADIRQSLVRRLDREYGCYEGLAFRAERFREYLRRKGWAWPINPQGGLCLEDDTFREMSRIRPELQPLRELRTSMSKMRFEDLWVGDDGRNRCPLSVFGSMTSRNQPSATRFVFGPSVWLRGLIKPPEGHGLAYIDWSQQEFGVAAALSEDASMLAAYESGDPYLAFAQQAGALPWNATKETHSAEREQYKACVLAVQYGMGTESLALRLGQPTARASQLLAMHRRVYRRYWHWIDAVVHEALLGGRLWTAFGWQLFVEGKPNTRSLGNFPMQANGAEMMRLACIRLVESGIQVIAPVHDALLIEAPLDQLEDAIRQTQDAMRWASGMVLKGFELSSEVKRTTFPGRYVDKRGTAMWNAVMLELDLLRNLIGTE